MKISQTLRRPENWQDFESLCLLLWREEWRSEDIKKNGRNGQAQNGVDICGHREGEDRYSGIQCKCTSGSERLTVVEISKEIDKAKTFKPALQRLVIATTSDKDATVEEYVRMKDEDNRRNNLFSIDIKSWQDIVDMLERNKVVLNTYLDIVAEDYAATISFADGVIGATIRPKWSRVCYLVPITKNIVDEDKRRISANSIVCGGQVSRFARLSAVADSFRPVISPVKMSKEKIEINHSYCPLKFRVVNQGRSPIDDYKIVFHFDNKAVKFVRNNVIKKSCFPEISFGGISNVSFVDGVEVVMYGNSIIPGDDAVTDDFFVHLPFDAKDVDISWRLLSRHYSTEGELKLLVEKEVVNLVEYDKELAGKTCVKEYIEVKEITD